MSKPDPARCTVCFEERKTRHRVFSPHAWTALTIWGEVTSSAENQSMCDGCYAEFRDLLIERAAEVELYASRSSANAGNIDLASVHEMTAFRGEAKAQIAS